MNRTELDSDMPVDAWQITFLKCVMGLCFFIRQKQSVCVEGKEEEGYMHYSTVTECFPLYEADEVTNRTALSHSWPLPVPSLSPQAEGTAGHWALPRAL